MTSGEPELFPRVDGRVDGDLDLFLVWGSVQRYGYGVYVAGAETQGVVEKVGDAAHGQLDERGAPFQVLRNQDGLELLIAELLHRDGVLRSESVLFH